MNSNIKKQIKRILPKFMVKIIRCFFKLCNKISSYFLSDSFQCFLYKCFNGYFHFDGNKYKYFISKYNTTWRNERTVEIPIIQKYLKLYINKNILEIGNVMNHYYNYTHTVVDKYEISNNVINCDILNYPPPPPL